MAEELRKWCSVAFVVLTINSGLAAYLLWGVAESVASVGVIYVVIVFLLARHFGCWEPGTHGGSLRWLQELILFLFLLDAALLASRVAQTAALSASALLVAAAGATALGVGGCFAYLLHRRSWSKQQRQKIILPLVQESRS
ncbi:unnamed protein product [Urochloa decumbens]|uniref:Uncharacterized protein n=1 Tax=Urochloa decumbens TaxID=240449 RepID=A0ABC8VEA2_9POAL